MLDSTFLTEVLQTARDAALTAGSIVRDQYSKPRQITEKGPRDLVTDTDHLAQEAALEIIRARHPDHGILAEEDPGNHATSEGRWHIPSGIVWLIDPVDGTTNFTTGLPFSCVSVGVAVDGVSVAGAIHDPYRDELFSAAQGQGARVNDNPLPPLPSVRLEHALLSIDWAHHPTIRSRALTTVQVLAPLSQSVRALGSAALAQAYVAAGRLHLYLNFGLQPWDVGAGFALITEVGGIYQTPGGATWTLGQNAVIAAHPALLAEVQPLIPTFP